jgi:glyoxylase-like metal-dependent hydrolase (beta-lactamase superfamily II)
MLPLALSKQISRNRDYRRVRQKHRGTALQGSVGGEPDFGITMHGQAARYPAGLQSIGEGLFAYMQPNGALGESNAGLVVGDGESLLVDTLWDLPSTARMLHSFSAITGQNPISKVVNTHSDGDHCWGNQLVTGAEILSTVETARQMPVEKPATLRAL